MTLEWTQFSFFPSAVTQEKASVIYHQLWQLSAKYSAAWIYRQIHVEMGVLVLWMLTSREPLVSTSVFPFWHKYRWFFCVFPSLEPHSIFHGITDFLNFSLVPHVRSHCAFLNHHYILLVYLFNCYFTMSFIFPFGLLRILVATLRILNLPCPKDLVVEW